MLLVAAIADPRSASACSCSRPAPSIARDLARAAAVFSGEVVGFAPERGGYGADEVRFAVRRVYKGELPEPSITFGDRYFGTCRYEFEVGESYLVWAGRGDITGEGGYLSTHICTRTARLADASADLEQLGDGRAPRAEERYAAGGGPDPSGGSRTDSARIILGVGGLCALAATFLRLRHRARDRLR